MSAPKKKPEPWVDDGADELRWSKTVEPLSRDPKVTPLATRVYAIVVSYMNRNGEATPSRETIAMHAGRTPNTIDGALNELERGGFLEIERRGAMETNVYRLGRRRPKGRSESSSAGTHSRSESSSAGTGVPVSSDHESSSAGTELEKPLEVDLLENTHASAFDIFWSRYPKKNGELDARKAFAKIKGVDLDDILAGLARWDEHWSHDETRFVTYCAKWLDGKMWSEEPPKRRGTVDARTQSNREATARLIARRQARREAEMLELEP